MESRGFAMNKFVKGMIRKETSSMGTVVGPVHTGIYQETPT